MKKYIVAILAVLTLCVASAFATPTLVLTWEPNHSPEAGEFLATPNTGTAFDTFCVEQTQYINLGSTYYYTVSDSSDGGRYGPQQVTLGTAWLYNQFRHGTLPGFTGTATQQNDLQNAFWSLQHEIAYDPSNPWISLAQTDLGANVNLEANSNGAYGVDIWNLFDSNGNECQSQLGLTVPDTANTGLLAGFGLLSLICVRKFARC